MEVIVKSIKMMLVALFVLVLIVKCCAQTFVDLGHKLRYGDPIFPLPESLKIRFRLDVLHNQTTESGFWLAYNSFCSVEHVSTHVDAPYHFNEHGWKVDQIPLEHFIAPAVVIDVTSKAAEDPNYQINAEDVEKWIVENGMIPNNSVILGRTGWSKKFKDPVAYLGHETDPTKLRFPGFGIDAVRCILNYKITDDIHAVGFGIDTISLDNGPSQLYEAHQAVLGENLYIIDNMNNLEALPVKGATLFVMPMKIEDGTGAPARVIAQLPPQMTTIRAAKSIS